MNKSFWDVQVFRNDNFDEHFNDEQKFIHNLLKYWTYRINERRNLGCCILSGVLNDQTRVV